MNNHEFRQIIHSLLNLTSTQKCELLDAVKSELNGTQTEKMIENIKGEVICFPHRGNTVTHRWVRTSDLQCFKCKEPEFRSTFNAIKPF